MLPDLGLGPLPFSSEKDQTKLEAGAADAFHAWKNAPGPITSGTLLKAVNPSIDSAIKSYGGSSIGSPTLRGHARRMALQAFQTYDPNRGSLHTHLLSQLQGLRRMANHEQNIIGMPEQVALDRSHLMRSEQELVERLGRSPSDMELADHTGLSLKRLGYIRQAQTPVAEGSATDEFGNNDRPVQQLGPQAADAAWQDFVYHDLSPVDQLIMEHTLGLRGRRRLPVQDIARKLGITAGAVSQRTAKIQGKLNERESLKLF